MLIVCETNGERMMSLELDEKQYLTEEKISSWADEWTFKGSNIGTYTHKIHRYPAMFIPQLVRKLLNEYSSENETILDVFNGSGSTSVEALITGRNTIGIEINPLANLIAEVKTAALKSNDISVAFAKIKTDYLQTQSVKLASFERIEFWFTDSVIFNLSKLKAAILKIGSSELKNFFLICLSENIRELSVCRHTGFKMHRDPKKIDKQYTSDEVFGRFGKSVEKNMIAVSKFSAAVEHQKNEKRLIQGSSTKRFEIDPVDFILTSPPYGDSRTTVAYGQFSRLCSQWLDLNIHGLNNIANLDKELLGGKVGLEQSINEVAAKSDTLQSALAYYAQMLASDKLLVSESKKLASRINDVASFYVDLDKTIANSAYYLKNGRHFVLVTGSRVVKMYKLHTDIIIAELAEHYGFKLSAIFYRNIENKRMPRFVSATNIVGEKAPTMTKESIVVLRKVN